MVQFIKAMRDEKGEMVRNAHLLGFFRRICKLLFLRTKPVFIFDGGTPALKRRTVIARRRQRENAQAKVRKTAEKLLLNQVKLIFCSCFALIHK
jgi:DNA excision repair protein ERCC-5